MSIKDIFRRKNPPDPLQRAEVVNGTAAHFSPWSGDAYSSDIYRGAIDAIARNAGKLKAAHVVKGAEGVSASTDARLNRFLQVQPNPYMNAFDMVYKLVTWLFLYNNSFAYLHRDERGNLAGVYPVMGSNVEFLADTNGAIYCRFTFWNGKNAVLPYVDIVHLRRHFNDNDLLGAPNSAIMPTLELAHTERRADRRHKEQRPYSGDIEVYADTFP